MATFQETEQEQQRYLQEFKQKSDQSGIINQLSHILSYSQRVLKSSAARRHIKNTIASLQNRQPLDLKPPTVTEVAGSVDEEIQNDPFFQHVETVVRTNRFLGDYKSFSFIELLKNEKAYQQIVDYIKDDERARDIKLTSEQRDIVLGKLKEWRDKLKSGVVSETRRDKKLEKRIDKKLQELEREQAQGRLTPQPAPPPAVIRQNVPDIPPSNLVFYACYGSNLLEDRFNLYLRNCKDRSKSREVYTYPIYNELYFGEVKSGMSSSGKAFIGHTKTNDQVLGKVYLITRAQFMDIFSQENGGKSKLSEQDMVEAKQKGFKDVSTKTAYGRLIYLETKKYDIFTFTDTGDIGVKRKIAKPDEKQYLPWIIKGLRQTYGLDANKIRDYLITKQGIAGNYSPQELLTLIKGVILRP